MANFTAFISVMFNRLKTIIQIPFFLLFIFMTLISCDQDDGIPMDEMIVGILSPSANIEIVDSVEFVGLLHADALNDLSSLQATWTSDKDGVLFKHTLDKSGYSKCKVKLSRNIHEITFEVSNGQVNDIV